MSKRKTPILLRRAPITGTVQALTNYRWRNKGRTLEAVSDGKHDVTADFDALVCELLLDPAPNILPILDGVRLGETPTADELTEVAAFRAALTALVERHNAGPHVAAFRGVGEAKE